MRVPTTLAKIGIRSVAIAVLLDTSVAAATMRQTMRFITQGSYEANTLRLLPKVADNPDSLK